MSFCHLHTHSEYSMLDGAARIRELVRQAAILGMPALGITDHGVLYGLIDFYEACHDEGIKPILGCELYLARESRFSKLPGDDNPKTIQHMTVLARNEAGYRNLLKLATAASLEGLYYKPRIDAEILAEHAEGLIGTTGCLNGQVPRLILEGRVAEAREAAGRWREIFGAEHFFIELQNHGIADQEAVNRQLVEFSSELGIPLLATNDLHYTHRRDAEAHDVLLCIQTGATVDEPGRLRFEGNEFYLKSREEMEAALGHYPEALDRTLDVAEMCDVKLTFGDLKLPDFIPPDGSSLEEYLRKLANEGAKQRYGDPLPVEVRERLDYELRVICDMGFAGYFLIVSDVIRWAKGKGIRVGPGRGSASASCAMYCLGATGLDPLRFNLMFERFLNPERPEMPDIDTDFDERYRGEVIRYLRERYGEDRVAQIVTFCLEPKARVLTEDLTWIPVKELVPGDVLIGFDEHADPENPKRGRKYRRSTVVANEPTSLPAYKITTDKGDVIASAGHLWLLRGKTRSGKLRHRQGWIATEDLAPGDRICWFGYPWQTASDRDAGWLAGIFDGEGSFDGFRIELAQNDGLVLDRITKTLTGLGFEYTISSTDHDCKHVLLTGGLYASLRFFGMLRPERFAGAYGTALEGRRIHGRVTREAIVEKLEFLGEHEVWAIETTTKTLIAEGLLSHNSTIKGKSAIRDAARVLGYPYGMGDRLAKMFPRPLLGKDPALEDCFERSSDSKWSYAFTEAGELRGAYEEEPDARKVLDAARKLEGLRRQTGVHAAAVVVGRDPLVNHTALQRTDNDDIVTQYEMHGIEKLGLLKMDILGLGNLTVIDLTLELLRQRGTELDIDNVSLDDPRVFEMLQRGDSDGTFQLESEGMRRLLKSLEPDRFEDIVALIALYRPGPMQEIPNYIEGKHHPERITYPHPLLEDILRDTYGVIVYQEQVLQLMQRIAGYTPGEAYIVVKAIAKKIEKLMKEHETKFLDGAAQQGLSAGQARELWNLLLPFAGYSFNRAHSACYGLIAYQTAYLKAHHPVEYLSALLTSVRDSKDEKTKYLAAARKMGIEILPPDVNLSHSEFSPDPERSECVRFGLAGIRNVGEGVVDHILAARREGRFKDFFDFCWRVDTSVLNKRTVESLIKAGAFDMLEGHPRGGLLGVFEQTTEQIASARRKESEGYVSLFDDGSGTGGDRTLVGSDLKIPDVPLSKPVMLAYEKEMLGQYVTDHPLAGLEETLACQTDASLGALSEVDDGGIVSVAGIVNKLGKKFTRKGELMFIVELEDLEASCEVIVFPAVAEKAGDLVALDRVLKIRGRVDHKDDAPKLVALEVAEPDYAVLDNPVRIRVEAARCTPDLVADLKSVLQEYPGPKPVFLHLVADERETVLRLGSEFRVEPGNGCVDRLRLLLGAEAVTL